LCERIAVSIVGICDDCTVIVGGRGKPVKIVVGILNGCRGEGLDGNRKTNESGQQKMYYPFFFILFSLSIASEKAHPRNKARNEQTFHTNIVLWTDYGLMFQFVDSNPIAHIKYSNLRSMVMGARAGAGTGVYEA
jgi:hypothetical protein